MQVMFGAMVINLVLAIFNMLPIPPLDGSRVIMVVLPHPLRRVWAQLEPYGLLIVMVLVYLGWLDDVLRQSVDVAVAFLLS